MPAGRGPCGGQMKHLSRRLAGLLVLSAALALAPNAFAQTGGTKPAPSATPAPPPASVAQAASTSEPVVLETTTGKLYGTIELPARAVAPYPVVLIISGSGPTDRNGNS